MTDCHRGGVYLSSVNTETEVNAMRYKFPLNFSFSQLYFVVLMFFLCVQIIIFASNILCHKGRNDNFCYRHVCPPFFRLKLS